MRLLVLALALASCAKGSSEPDGEKDASAPDAGGCPDGQCAFEGACVLPTVCHPVFPGLVCALGEWLDTCGNGVCDCGEGPGRCVSDCDCQAGSCLTDDGCVAAGGCDPGAELRICSGGVFVPSCGNESCDCGEAAETCAVDCWPDEPSWSSCAGRTNQYASCEGYCSTLGLSCSDSCTTSLGRPNWGAEAWPAGEECRGRSSDQAGCGDTWADDPGDPPRWKCCCRR